MRIGELIRDSHSEYKGLPGENKSYDHQCVGEDDELNSSNAFTKKKNGIIQNLIAVFKEYEIPIEKRGISITTNLFDPGFPTINDENRLVLQMSQMVFPWILTNFEAAKKGEPAVDIEVSFEERSRYMFRLRIKGVDLVPVSKEKPSSFNSGSSHMTDLELKRVLEYVGGSFRVQMKPNLLIVYQLPVKSPRLDWRNRKQFGKMSDLSTREFQPMLQRKIKVLFVENHEGQRELFSFIAERERFVPITVSDGTRAVEVVDNDREFDCIIIDAKLELMHGDETIRRIRALGYAGAIIGVTGSSTSRDITELINAGADTVIAKPFSFKRLMRLIKQRIKTNRREAIPNGTESGG